MMRWHDGDTTDGALLARLGDWADHGAWTEFVRRYDPAIRRTCRAYRFDAETLEELCQRIWVELARRMQTYRYDPGSHFRGWLRRLWATGHSPCDSLTLASVLSDTGILPGVQELFAAVVHSGQVPQ